MPNHRLKAYNESFATRARAAARGVVTLAIDFEQTLRTILIRELDLEETVDLRGIVDVNTAYEECDVVVIPRSRPLRMASPVRIIESLAMQRPLIVSTVCDMDQLIEGCGLAVEPGEPDSIAAAMFRLATDGELYQRLVANCSSKALEYDSERSLGQMYSELKLAFAGEGKEILLLAHRQP